MTKENETTMSLDEQSIEEQAPSGFSRRTFLVAGSALGAAVIVAACGSDDDSESGSDPSAPDPSGDSDDDGSGDVAVAKFAAGLEVLAVGTYKAALDAATGGKLGPVPPAVATYVQTAMKHHEEHLAAWNEVITGADGEEVTEPNADLKKVVDEEFAKVKDVGGAAKLALMLEDIAAQTYLKALPSLKSPDAIKLAASIQAVDQQHQAILLFALGEYPVPETFQKTDKAASPS